MRDWIANTCASIAFWIWDSTLLAEDDRWIVTEIEAYPVTWFGRVADRVACFFHDIALSLSPHACNRMSKEDFDRLCAELDAHINIVERSQ